MVECGTRVSGELVEKCDFIGFDSMWQINSFPPICRFIFLGQTERQLCLKRSVERSFEAIAVHVWTWREWYLQGLLIFEGWTLIKGETGLSTNEPKPIQKSVECSNIRRDRAMPAVFSWTTDQ